MFLNYQELLIVIIITSVLLYLITNYIQIELNHLNKTSLDSILQTCKTGDLIITRWNYIDIAYRIFCKYCHVGVIYKNSKGTFLIETHPEESDTQLSGVNMYLLKDRIENYDGTCYFLKLNQSNKNKIQNYTDIITKNLKLYKSIPFSNDFRIEFLKGWFYNKLNLQNKYNKSDRSMYCSELIGFILKDIGILNNNFIFLSPDSFENLTIKGKYIYDNSREITLI